MNEYVTVRDARRIKMDGWIEVSAEVDGERIWFKISDNVDVSIRAEPFVAAGLLEAMVRGTPLKVDKGIPLSPVLNQRLNEIQEIYRCWNRDLSVVPVSATLEEAEGKAGNAGVFYSAGVDSSHALLRHRNEVDALVFILGFDGGTSDHDWEERISEHQKFADKIDKKLVVIKTNARDFANKRRISWHFGHGLCLSTLASMLNYNKT